jgi:rhodanese-related sulfurtransferase
MIRQLTVSELKERLDKGSNDFVVIDVREPWEIAVCALPGAVSIPMRAIPARYPELSKDTELVLMCHHGVRSQHVAQFLQSQGFEKLSNLVGGINAWAIEIDPDMAKY